MLGVVDSAWLGQVWLSCGKTATAVVRRTGAVTSGGLSPTSRMSYARMKDVVGCVVFNRLRFTGVVKTV